MEDEFDFTAKDLKHYPHFDAPLSLREIRRLVTSPERVAANTFYPFFLYEESWQPYRSADAVKPEKKTRPIRYGARRDAYIFAFYRRKLSRLYEARLRALGIQDCPIAYRQVSKQGRGGGKCNIDFAKDAFDEIDRLGDCVAVALDIKGYFENLDHRRIKKIWCNLLGVAELPPDHYAVFKNITKYHFVDQRTTYRRLGYFGLRARNGQMIDGFLRPHRDMPKQLCSNADFRAKICGGDPALPSIIQKNDLPHGVPQGAPISDLIANFYLLDFDVVMAGYARARGGRYMRYSDDILMILPGGPAKRAPQLPSLQRRCETTAPSCGSRTARPVSRSLNGQQGRLHSATLCSARTNPLRMGLSTLVSGTTDAASMCATVQSPASSQRLRGQQTGTGGGMSRPTRRWTPGT